MPASLVEANTNAKNGTTTFMLAAKGIMPLHPHIVRTRIEAMKNNASPESIDATDNAGNAAFHYSLQDIDSVTAPIAERKILIAGSCRR
jgi:hypothetical protein